MANGNPFYVDPGGNILPGLGILQRGLTMGKEKRRKKKASEAALEAYKTKDPDKIAQAILQNPEIAETLGNLYERDRKYKKEDYATSLAELLTELETTGSLKEKAQEALMPPGIEDSEVTSSPEIEELGIETSPTVVGGLMGFDPEALKSVEAKVGPGTKPPADKLGILRSVYKQNPNIGKKMIEFEFAKANPKEYKAWKEVYRPGATGKVAQTDLMKSINERKALMEKGFAEDSPEVMAFNRKIWPEKYGGSDKQVSNTMRMFNERKALLDAGMDPNSDIIRGLSSKILGNAAKKIYSPSNLMKMYNEREELLKQGMTEEDPIIKAFDRHIAGIDIDVTDLTPEEYEFWGIWSYITGKMPSVGRGKMATKVRMGILAAGAKYGLKVARDELRAAGVEVGKEQDPAVAAFKAVATSTDTATIKGALGFLEKQEAAMGSYVANIDKQLTEFKKLAEDLYTFDARALNIPLRFLRGKIAGSALQAKYDMFLMDVSREITKLASGSTQSIAPPSVQEIENWDRVHDPNLSARDAVDVLEKSLDAAQLRMDSISEQLARSRQKIRDRDYEAATPKIRENIREEELPEVSTQEEYNELKKRLGAGTRYFNPKTGKTGTISE